jgi:23S rRNA (guanosine2251-2'-O)-methyltransferase
VTPTPRRKPASGGNPRRSGGASQPKGHGAGQRRANPGGYGGGQFRQPRRAAPDRRHGQPGRSSGTGAAAGAHAPSSSAASALGGEQVEGRRAVRELFVAGRRRVREIWVSEPGGAGEADDVVELARAARVPVRVVGAGRIAAAARTSAPQGVIAFADPLPDPDLLELVTGGLRSGVPFLVVLDGVTDPHNLGAVLRAAECAGATGAVVPRHRAAHVTATVAKVAAGAVEHLPIAVVSGVPSALAELQRLGVWTVGLAPDGPVALFGLHLATSPIALVLGSEGRGLSRLARARCDEVARIPLGGAIESLNVASAAAIACFEVLRQRQLAAGTSGG